MSSILELKEIPNSQLTLIKQTPSVYLSYVYVRTDYSYHLKPGENFISRKRKKHFGLQRTGIM